MKLLELQQMIRKCLFECLEEKGLKEGWKGAGFAAALGAAALINPDIQKKLNINQPPPPSVAQQSSEKSDAWSDAEDATHKREKIVKYLGKFPSNVMKSKAIIGDK